MDSSPNWKRAFLSLFVVVNNAQGATAINVVVASSSPSGSSGAVAGHPSSSSGLFSCAKDGCVKMNYE